ncbi:DUF4859 domain-containing protein [Maribellus maritimus]|uniref:DUF4859 domain-containing protein n=1 Tax=Maribellus maritimus TaxID=2870838 RepID=UPI001EEAA407|nr:DUF4859 domain-containing protein [Maribellus maritimus]MCG6188629.1 DUF4859 domain-containing protein [Maribellus maritimus]
MKRNFIYIIITSFIFLFSACDDVIEDATSKHIYGDNENPYLRVDVGATVITDMEFEKGYVEPDTLNLNDYADVFQEKMNMTVDQVLSSLEDGSVVFDNINITRNIWTKAEKTNNSSGWYYNSAGGLCSADDPAQTASIELDKANKSIIVDMNEAVRAGIVLNLNVGFALDGPDYDDYVRFSFNLSVTDPAVIIVSVNIPAGDYVNTGINFADYAENIQTTMGMSVTEFFANLDYNGDTGAPTEGTIHMYVVDNETEEWDETSDYTAEAPGYWLNAEGEVSNWTNTGEGFNIYANTKPTGYVLFIGRAPGLAAGSSYTFSIGYRDTENLENHFRFVITATLE